MATILQIDGHPDADGARFVHALANAHAGGAASAGHSVRRLKLATLDVSPLRSRAVRMDQAPPRAIAAAQNDISWASHLVCLYQLWLGDMPALRKGVLEQVAAASRWRKDGHQGIAQGAVGTVGRDDGQARALLSLLFRRP